MIQPCPHHRHTLQSCQTRLLLTSLFTKTPVKKELTQFYGSWTQNKHEKCQSYLKTSWDVAVIMLLDNTFCISVFGLKTRNHYSEWSHYPLQCCHRAEWWSPYHGTINNTATVSLQKCRYESFIPTSVISDVWCHPAQHNTARQGELVCYSFHHLNLMHVGCRYSRCSIEDQTSFNILKTKHHLQVHEFS